MMEFKKPWGGAMVRMGSKAMNKQATSREELEEEGGVYSTYIQDEKGRDREG